MIRWFWTSAIPASPMRSGVVWLCLLFAACSSGGSGDGDVLKAPTVATFEGGGTPAEADLIRLTGEGSGDEVTVTVVITGETDSQDLYAFAFDLVIGNPAIFEYVPGSISAGGALTTEGDQEIEAFAGQNGKRVKVGVSKFGGGAGNVIPEGDATIATLRLRALEIGTTTLTLAKSPPKDYVAENSTAPYPEYSVEIDPASSTIAAN